MAQNQKAKKTGSGSGLKRPTIVGINLVSETYEYLSRLLDLGALEGPLGRMDINASLKPVVEAMHHVLTGGAVEVKVRRRGNPDLMKNLDLLLKNGCKKANEINKKLGQPGIACA